MTENLKFHDPEILQRELSYAEVESLKDLHGQFIDRLLIADDIDPVLKKLCQAVEALLPDCAASIMQYAADDQILAVRMAPSLSPEAISDLNSLRVGEGSCGNAVFHNAAMFVGDTTSDTRWENIREFAFKHRVKSCWSMPVHNGQDQIIGTFALSHFTSRQPDTYSVEILQIAAKLAAMAIIREYRERHLRNLAHIDSLTGLANRAMLDLTLEHSIERARRKQSALAVVFMDLDGFKKVNDHHGHAFGDSLLRTISRYMDEAIAGEHFLARFGGDEFVLLLEDDYWSETIHRLMEQLRECVYRAALDHKITQVLGISFGVSHFPDDAEQAADLIRLADSAMFERKIFSEISNRSNTANRAVDNYSDQQLINEQELKDFDWHFRVQMDSDDNPVGLSTVMTWQHPKQGRVVVQNLQSKILTAQFCHNLFTQLVDQLTLLKAEINITLPAITIPVAVPLVDTKLINILSPGLMRAGFCPTDIFYAVSELDLEVANIQEREMVRRLSRSGFRMQLNDFGAVTGALHRLKCLAPARVCLSSTIIESLTTDPASEALARSLQAAAISFDVDVIADGLQNDEQRARLQKMGYGLFEGGIISPLLSAIDLRRIFNNR